MELPVTREQLRAYAVDYPIIQRKAAIDRVVADVFKKVQQHIVVCNPRAPPPTPITFGSCTPYVDTTKLTPTSFVWKPELSYQWGNGCGSNLTVEELVDALKEKFIGVSIVTDPLKTYILIDWS